ncbi:MULTISPECIES: PilZ domain-containing protein [unclassified Vibrio]|uniref:PilZ domain-containing protein n=1 Tax=Vibrio sp. HB236076 TaxID=3232307 RepID=A0AB39HI38_9VIBR|nr:PilZ domain-containing protein [Vibrio sp. HB161653]MDP5254921.1 PilZ domain-containing protein [Vibrio sp. HB161653]
MQPSEILSLVERLIPVYHAPDFEQVLERLVADFHPSAKIIVKIELNRLMEPCGRTIDLRGRVNGDCREYRLDGRRHWLDDVAFNDYQKQTKKFGGYTTGVWEALSNTRNNYRIIAKNRAPAPSSNQITSEDSPFQAEPIQLGQDLKRQEKRLRLQTQVEITLPKGQIIHGLTIDMSESGAKIKVPSAFVYQLGDILDVEFVEYLQYATPSQDYKLKLRLLAVEENLDNDAIKILRTVKASEKDLLATLIDDALRNPQKRLKHDNQDKILRARARGFEHIFLKHTCHLPLFFSQDELKLAMLTPNNQRIWQYWHNEQGQQVLGTLFHPQRLKNLTHSDMSQGSCKLYAFQHQHEQKTFFYSMFPTEATQEQTRLFWHVGAKRESWKVFQVSFYRLLPEDKEQLSRFQEELGECVNDLTHCAVLQEIGDHQQANDYLLSEKPRLPVTELNSFRQSRRLVGNPRSVYFDATSRRKEPRFIFKTPLILTHPTKGQVQGHSVDFSGKGISVQALSPLPYHVGELISINMIELNKASKQLDLSTIPYKVVKVSNEGNSIQLVMQENDETSKVSAFLKSIFKLNKDKLKEKEERLPSHGMLNALHQTLLSKMKVFPFYIDKGMHGFQTRVIGVSYPLPKHIDVLSNLGHKEYISLEPLFKNRTNTLLATPLKRSEKQTSSSFEIYIGLEKLGRKPVAIHTKLAQDFTNIKQRIAFIKSAQISGEFIALRLSMAPIYSPITLLLQQELNDLTQVSVHQASALERELTNLVGYGEIEDITEEVLIRLQLTH